jgi:hypothetical protein
VPGDGEVEDIERKKSGKIAMARNKRNGSDLRVGPALTAGLLCALFVGLGVGYVGYKNQLDVLGRQIKERETRLADLQRENKMRRDQLGTLCSPVALDARVKKLNLGLGPPALSQVIRLADPPSTEAASAPPSQGRQALAGTAERRD